MYSSSNNSCCCSWNVDTMAYFEEAEDDIVKIAKKEALQYVLENVEDTVRPVITAAFWGTWEQLYSTQSFDTVMKNGGYIIQNQLASYDVSAKEWQEYYDLDIQQMNLVRILFDKKMKSGREQVMLDGDDLKFLYGDVEECFISLEELNIVKGDE